MATQNRIPFSPGQQKFGGARFRFEANEPQIIDGETGQLERYHSEIEVILALQKARGFRSIAAELLGLSTNGLNRRIRGSENLKQVMRDIDAYWIDHTEIKLFEAVDSGNVDAIKFVLKCKGRQRGWVERREVMMAMGISVNGEFEDAVKPPDLILGFTETVNSNAPEGTTAIVHSRSNGDNGSTSTTAGTTKRTTTNGHGATTTG